MTYCQFCGTANRDGSKFCNECGGSLREETAACPECQARNPLTSWFCGACGRPLHVVSQLAARGTLAPPISLPILEEADDELPSLEADVPPLLDLPSPPSVALPAWLDFREESAFSEGPEEAPSAPAELGSVSGKHGAHGLEALSLSQESSPAIQPGLDRQISLPASGAGSPPVSDATIQLPDAPLSLPDRPAISDAPPAATLQDGAVAVAGPSPFLPGWLDQQAEVGLEVEASGVQSAPEPQEAELASSLEVAESAMVASELPSWLLMPEPARTEAEQIPAWLWLPEPPSPPAALPSWLGLPEVASSAGALPSWLFLAEPASSSRSEPALTRDSEPASTCHSEPAGEESSRVLPGWLTLPDDSPGSPSSQILPAWLLLPDTAQPVEHALPEWLLMADQTALASPAVATSRVLPSWLDLPDVESLVPRRDLVLPGWLDLVDPAPQLQPVMDSLAVLPVAVEYAPVDTAPALSLPRIAEPPDVFVLPGIAMARPFVASSSPRPKPAPEGPVPDYEGVFVQIMAPKAASSVAPPPLTAHHHRVVSLLLVMVMAVALRVPMWINVEPGQATTQVFQTIQALPASANVLMSFDWPAGADDEMAPIAEAITAHLAKKKARIIAVSLVPEGTKLAQRVLDRSLQLKSKDNVYGNQVVILGYLPGEESAIQAMSADLIGKFGVDYRGTPTRALPLLMDVKNIEKVALVVELSDQPEMLTKWVTQLSATHPNVRMVAGVGAASLPWAQPFSAGGSYGGKSHGLQGVVTGIRGAAEYESLLNKEPGDKKLVQALNYVDALSYGSVFLVLVIVAGNLAQLRAAWKRSRLARKVKSDLMRS